MPRTRPAKVLRVKVLRVKVLRAKVLRAKVRSGVMPRMRRLRGATRDAFGLWSTLR